MPSIPLFLRAGLAFTAFWMVSAQQPPTAESLPAPSLAASVRAVEARPDTPFQRRIAVRLQKRIERNTGVRVSIEDAVAAVQSRQDILRRTAEVRFIDRERGADVLHGSWSASAREHASWIRFSMEKNIPRFAVDRDGIRVSIESGEPANFPRPQNGILRFIRQDRRILRGVPEGVTQAGYVFDAADLSGQIARALSGQTEGSIQMAAAHVEPQLFLIDEHGGTRTLTRLSVGRSDFARSPWGRVQNIRRALIDRINGAVIPAGSTFSFNDALVGAGRWEQALVIVNGKDLVYEPGGGICQASTTVYRSLLLAGLPVTERKSHSLYVTYYKDYGVGIDATVYYGKQDLKVQNDTPGDLVMLARIEGSEATVELFGIPDGRRVAMEGPYFAETAPDYVRVNGRLPRKSEIVWTQNVTYADGRSEDHTIVSQYNSIPRSLHQEFPVSRGIAELMGTYLSESNPEDRLALHGSP